MTERILGEAGPKRKRRFPLMFLPLLLVAALALLLAGAAKAVHDEAFQLDGDVSASTTTNNGGHLQPFDWDSFFSAAGQKSPGFPMPRVQASRRPPSIGTSA